MTQLFIFLPAGALVFMLLFFLLIAAGVGFLNGSLAKKKGYPFWVGAISGLFLFYGLIVTIVLLIIPQNQERITKKCPFCGEEILFSATKCKCCGEWLEKPTPE